MPPAYPCAPHTLPWGAAVPPGPAEPKEGRPSLREVVSRCWSPGGCRQVKGCPVPGHPGRAALPKVRRGASGSKPLGSAAGGVGSGQGRPGSPASQPCSSPVKEGPGGWGVFLARAAPSPGVPGLEVLSLPGFPWLPATRRLDLPGVGEGSFLSSRGWAGFPALWAMPVGGWVVRRAHFPPSPHSSVVKRGGSTPRIIYSSCHGANYCHLIQTGQVSARSMARAP